MSIRMDGQVAVVTGIREAGGGSFAVFKGYETRGVNLLPDKLSPEGVAAAWEQICDETDMRVPRAGFEQTEKFALQGADKLGMKLS